MKREKLLRSREYWINNIQNDLYGMIEEYMNKEKINRSQIADKLQVSKGYVTQVLKGDFDHKVSKLVDLSLAFNKVPIIRYLDIDKYVKDDAENKPICLDNPHLPKVIQYNFYDYSGEGFTTEVKAKNTKNTLPNFLTIELAESTQFETFKSGDSVVLS